MATDLTLYLDDQPGELARLGEVLGDVGVNIEGFCAVTSGDGQAEVAYLATGTRLVLAADNLAEAKAELA